MKPSDTVAFLRKMADDIENGVARDEWQMTAIIHNETVYDPCSGMPFAARYNGTTLVVSTLPLGAVAAEMHRRYMAEIPCAGFR